FVQSLRLMPSICTLKIYYCEDSLLTNRLIACLARRPQDSPGLLPNLQVLDLNGCHRVEDQTLIETLQSRRMLKDTEADGSLQRASLFLRRRVSSETQRSLRVLGMGGLDLDVKFLDGQVRVAHL